jgi:hypothetical protein
MLLIVVRLTNEHFIEHFLLSQPNLSFLAIIFVSSSSKLQFIGH